MERAATVEAESRLVVGPGAMRLILAGAVLFGHLTVFQTGRAAVLLFFVLSGYWVTRLWETTRGPRRLQAFYLNRWLRIWPLYALVMAVCVVGLGREAAPRDLLLLGVASKPGEAAIGVEWSLDIELQFYLALPLLSWIVHRCGGVAAIALATLATALGWLLWAETGWATFLRYLPAFAIGMAIYYNAIRPSADAARLSLMAFLWMTAAIVGLPASWQLLATGDFTRIDQDLFAFVWILPLLPYLARSIDAPSPAGDRVLGDLSYPFYLVHAPLMLIAFGGLGLSAPLGAAAVTIATFLMALAIYRWVDRPLERLRRASVRHVQERTAGPWRLLAPLRSR